MPARHPCLDPHAVAVAHTELNGFGLEPAAAITLLAIDFAVIGVGFALMAASTSPTAYAWGAGVQQIGCGLILPTLLVWATRGLAFEVRGRGTGVWQAAFAIGQFLVRAGPQLLKRSGQS